MTTPAELAITAEQLKNMLVARATGGGAEERVYLDLRRTLLSDGRSKASVPRFVVTCRSTFEFWEFIKHKFGSYAERRQFIWDEFNPLIEKLEGHETTPVDDDVLERLDWEHVHAAWRKALDRKVTDPEGAITAARTLLETTCKHILDESNTEYDPKADLPKLYHLAAERLNLSPSQHVETVFKQILQGCVSVVQGLGTVRSRIGDAHGQGKNPIRPAPRHAELVVNLAGSMATFLAATWEASKTAAANG